MLIQPLTPRPVLGPTFQDIIGLKQEVEALKTFVEILRDSARYEALGASLPKGLILHGPPGTGKTLIARALQTETQLPFYPLDAGDVLYQDDENITFKRLVDVFKKAAEAAPSVIFIDEIETFLGLNDYGPGDLTTLNHLLKLMDGFYPSDKVIVLAATNDLSKLPYSLLRPGRFDKHIALTYPNAEAIEHAVRTYAKAFKFAPNLSMKRITDVFANLTIAEIKHLMNDVLIDLIQSHQKTIEERHIIDAIDNYHLGLHQNDIPRHDDLTKRIAYHEAAHAVLHATFGTLDTIARISIVAHANSQGHVRILEDAHRDDTQQALENQMTTLLAGYAAEQHFFDETSAGCRQDLKRATQIATKMVRYYGMNDLNIPRFFRSGDRFMPQPLSADLEAMLDDNINRLLKDALERARHLVALEEKTITRVAHALIERKVLVLDEFKALLDDNVTQ